MKKIKGRKVSARSKSVRSDRPVSSGGYPLWMYLLSLPVVLPIVFCVAYPMIYLMVLPFGYDVSIGDVDAVLAAFVSLFVQVFRTFGMLGGS